MVSILIVAIVLGVFASVFSAVTLFIDWRWGGRGVAVLVAICSLVPALEVAQDPARGQPRAWVAGLAMALIAFVAPASAIVRAGRRQPPWSSEKRWFAGVGASYLAAAALFPVVVLVSFAIQAVRALLG